MKKLGFGFMRLPVVENNPKRINVAELCRMVDLFLERGFTYFDTSFVYHQGESETAIRKTLVERHSRGKFILASKLPAFALTSEMAVRDTFMLQLDKCGVDYFDYYLLHNLNDHLADTAVIDGAMFPFIRQMKAEGKIRNIGFSYHDSAEVLDKILSQHPEVDFVQLVINYYDWESPLIQARQCYEVARMHHKQIVVMEPVKGGMLADVPAAARALMSNLQPAVTPAAWALRFAADHDGVLTVLSGMSTIEQVRENTATLTDHRPLTVHELAMLEQVNEVFRSIWKVPVQKSDYPRIDSACPKNIPISSIIDSYNSCLLQPNPRFTAGLNYYKNIKRRYRATGECDNCHKCSAICSGDVDIASALKQAAAFFEENGFK